MALQPATFQRDRPALLSSHIAMSVKCTVTWGKQTFKDVEVDTTQTPETFKFQLYSLTGVPPERQKITGLKGGLLKDSADWKAVGLKPGQKLMLMGTADKVGCPAR